MSEKMKPIDKLMAAADAYSIVRAEANWTNGYRARLEVDTKHNDIEADRLRRKEMAQWGAVEAAEAKMRRAFLRVLRGAK